MEEIFRHSVSKGFDHVHMLSESDNTNNDCIPSRNLREICGTDPDLLCFVVLIALWVLVRQPGLFKLIQSIS